MKIIEVIADNDLLDTIKMVAHQHGALDIWFTSEGEDGRQAVRLLVSAEKRQAMLDALQSSLASSKNIRILVMPLEAALPLSQVERKADQDKPIVTATREELYNQVEKGARLDSTYLMLVVLSTIVVAIGLNADNIAVVIGAMVIAPLLGPNIALALATALGDTMLMWKSLKTGLTGLGIGLALTFMIGSVMPINLNSHELMARTDVGLDSVALALASGAAAALSFSTGLSSVLVGVMVAVALLPPTATMGIMLGTGQFDLATGAALLLAVNLVAVNLSAKVVFLMRGIKPRTWWEKEKARQSLTIYIAIWVLSLAILIGAIFLRHELPIQPLPQ